MAGDPKGTASAAAVRTPARRLTNRPIRCSTAARESAVDPIGTAGSYDSIVLVPRPLPWPKDAAEDAVASAVRQRVVASGDRSRLQLVSAVPTLSSATLWPDDEYAVYSRTSEMFREMRRLGQDGSRALPLDQVRDVLVCTHGKRDVCCGKLGTQLVGELSHFGDGVRVWRTSHLGGHRFAPTALVLPEGTMWAFLDATLLAGIVHRTVDPSIAARHYRGCVGLDGADVQAVDREMFASRGWDWLDVPRRGELIVREGDRALTRLRYDAGSGAIRTVEAVVSISRRLPTIECGVAIQEPTKFQLELRVSNLHELL